MVRVTESRVLHMLGKGSTSKLHPQPSSLWKNGNKNSFLIQDSVTCIPGRKQEELRRKMSFCQRYKQMWPRASETQRATKDTQRSCPPAVGRQQKWWIAAPSNALILFSLNLYSHFLSRWHFYPFWIWVVPWHAKQVLVSDRVQSIFIQLWCQDSHALHLYGVFFF